MRRLRRRPFLFLTKIKRADRLKAVERRPFANLARRRKKRLERGAFVILLHFFLRKRWKEGLGAKASSTKSCGLQ